MGDNVLMSVAQCIEDTLNRADDYCFRLGGEEFGVIFQADTKENITIEEKQQISSDWFRELRDKICKEFELIESYRLDPLLLTYFLQILSLHNCGFSS